MEQTDGSLQYTIHVEDGEVVYPCRCGVTHRGPYAFYNYGHHTCFHDAPLVRIAPEEDPDYLMCGACGQTFTVEQSGRTPWG